MKAKKRRPVRVRSVPMDFVPRPSPEAEREWRQRIYLLENTQQCGGGRRIIRKQLGVC